MDQVFPNFQPVTVTNSNVRTHPTARGVFVRLQLERYQLSEDQKEVLSKSQEELDLLLDAEFAYELGSSLTIAARDSPDGS